MGAWVTACSFSSFSTDEADAEIRLLEAAARAAEIVGVYLIPVATAKGGIQTTHFREAFRATGPSNYASHGKQAQFKQERI